MLLRYHGLIPSICETRSDRDTQIEDDPLTLKLLPLNRAILNLCGAEEAFGP